MTTEQNQNKESKVKRASSTSGGTKRRSNAKSTGGSAGVLKPSRRTSAKRKRPAEKMDKKTPKTQPKSIPRLLGTFRRDVSAALSKEFGYSSYMAVPKLSKIVLNIGLGEALENPKAIENATRDLSLISGQHPVTRRARKSIAAFKLRDGQAIGLMVSLRGRRMYEFFDRMISAALPRIRDFRGVSRESFDGRGNYAIGIREQVIFPEIEYNSIDRIRGLQVIIVTTARTDHEGLRLLEMMGMPFAQSVDEASVA